MAAESLPVPTPRALPSSIGHYDIVALLGEGGMARVFLALRRGAFASEKLVVIKQVRPEYSADNEFLAMFMDEARIALQLNHPNVVHTYEVVGEYPDYFLAMEFLEGRTLAQVLRAHGRRSFPVDLHIWILIQVLSGLEYAHELRDLDGTQLGIVHRDVNPSNVFITSSGEVRLVDFGIAKAAGAVTFTQQGVVKGKIGYAAPEQCLGRATDARTDLFAVGIMLWEAIAGQRRSPAESGAAALQARVANQEPALEQVVADVSPRLIEICRRALAYAPEQRYSSAAELRAELEAHLEERQARPNARELADLMGNAFGKDLAEMRGQVEAHVQEGRRASVRHAPDSGSASHAFQVSNVSQLSAASAAGPAGRTKRALIAAGVALAVASMTLLLLVLAKNDPLVERHSLVGSEASPPTPSRSSPVAADPAMQSVRIAIAATPKRAQLSLDGRRVANPFVGELPRDDRDHELEVRASGYRSERQVVRLSQDLALTIELRPEAAGAKSVRSTLRSTSSAPSLESLPSALPSWSSQPGSRPTQSEALLQPGQDLTKPPRAVRELDEKDPYR